MILNKRVQQGSFETAATANRDQGSGAGVGSYALANLGFFSGSSLGTYATGGAGSWTTISGSAFTVQINRATLFIYMLFATCWISGPNSLSGYVRGNIAGFDVTAAPWYSQGDSHVVWNGFMWYFPKAPIQPGAYTVSLEAATDNGATLHVTQAQHQFLDIGA